MTLFSCIVGGLLLGLSQPLYIHASFGEALAYQDWLGLLALVGYVPLFVAIANRDLKSTLWLSFATITTQLTVVLYWIYIALNVHGHIPPIPAAAITVVLPMVLGLMGSVFLVLGRFLSLRFSIPFFVIAPFALCAAELFRNYNIFGGFPWGNVGYSLGRVDEVLQVASLIGVYGLVFLAGLINSLLALWWVKGKAGLKYGAIALVLVIMAFSYGAIRLNQAQYDFAPGIRVALVQGNIPQEVKSEARLHAKDILDIFTDLHQRAKDAGANLIVWPESSYPRMLNKDVTELSFAREKGVASIVGAVVYGENAEGDGYYVHNSGLLLDYFGAVVKRYDKSHLVPFGEYVPWPMSGIVGKIVPGLGAFRPGVDFAATKLPVSDREVISVGTTVCYEGIFPEISRAYAKNGAALLINLTNDAWYGYSSAPYQHLLMYRMRSVESGLPFVRATNSGVSAFIDPYGRLSHTTKLFERGFVIDDVPLLKKSTLYVVLGDVIPVASILLLIMGYVAAVLPVVTFFRQRQWWKFAVMIAWGGLVTASHLYFSQAQFLADESAQTKNLFIFLLSLLLLIGLLSETKRSRSILIACGSVLVVCSLALAFFESWYFLFGVVFGLLIYLLAFRIKIADPQIK